MAGAGSDPFVHLHVASGYSLRHGASHPEALVEVAAGHGMDALALTDRDGIRGAVKFAMACDVAGLRPILGTDLATAPIQLPSTPRPAKTPARGGTTRDLRLPRITLLARGRRGYAALCRLISATHLSGERGDPVTTLERVSAHASDGGLVVLLGPASQPGRALARGRIDAAAALLASWRDALPPDALRLEVVCHLGADAEGRSLASAARALRFADEQRIPAVLTNTVRYARRDGAPVADVLDAIRRLVPLDLRHIDRRTGEGWLKPGTAMRALAVEIASAAGDETRAGRLLSETRALAESCTLDPSADLGIGEVHFPELDRLDRSGRSADVVLRERCEAGLGHRGMTTTAQVRTRLDDELDVIRRLGYPTYFLTVADVCDLVRSMDVRIAARGSGAGSLVNYLLGISGVDPIHHGLLFERFLSPLRRALPDVDIDVESARRTEIYQRILDRFGGERCTCVSMTDTYRVRHAIRDVGAALGLPPGEIDTIAKAFPHIRARDARNALRELPELRSSGLGSPGDSDRAGPFDLLFHLVEKLDGLPRHLALHPCGVLLSDATLLDRTPVEASYLGFPMSQFDKDDVEHLGLLKLDVLGIRMQSAMAHAVDEIARVDGPAASPDLDAIAFDDEPTFELIRSTHTLGCFQIESPGQRELVGKFGPETFGDLIVDISLFRPGPVKSDMVTPFLRARQGWEPPRYLHPDLEPALRETEGVIVFHEQVLQVIAVFTGCSLAEADEARRALGDPEGQAETREWFYPRALRRGYALGMVEKVWEVLRAFASFGFCKAHAAAFAVPTYHSAWLKAHHPAAFLAGVLTHDPGMYPKRLILDDARQMGIAVLSLDVNASDAVYRIERVAIDAEPPPGILGAPAREAPRTPGVPDGRAYGIRLALADVKGISDAEVARVVASRPYHSLTDFWHRAGVSRPVVERLVMAGAFDDVYGLGATIPVRRRGRVTRRDLLLQVGELDRWTRPSRRSGQRPSRPSRPSHQSRDEPEAGDVRALAARQSKATRAVGPIDVQLALDLGPGAHDGELALSGLPEMNDAERVRAELDILGLDVSRHVVDFYAPLFDALGVVRSRDLLSVRSRTEILVAGVKVATQTPPIRSGRRVVFVTLDDATGPIDATFFEDAQGPYAATLFHSWLLLVRGVTRRTGPRGISIRATGCWELAGVNTAWERGGLSAAWAQLDRDNPFTEAFESEGAVVGAAESRSTRPVMTKPPSEAVALSDDSQPGRSRSTAGGMGRRRVLVHASGFRQSPYADVRPPGEGLRTGRPPRSDSASGTIETDAVDVEAVDIGAVDAGAADPPARPPRRLWHSSPGSAG